MSATWSRREFLRAAGVLGGSVGLMSFGRAEEATPPSLSAYQFECQVWVGYEKQTIACYRAHATQKYPYFYPFIGPATGRPLTTEAGDQYPHHRSILFACDRVNGANYWQEGLDRGRILSTGVTSEAQPDRVIVRDACEWRQPTGETDITDARAFTITAPAPGVRLLAADIICTAARPVQIQRTNHALFAVRAALDLAPVGGGKLRSSEGAEAEAGTFGKPARWCTFFGSRLGTTEGVALMDHPGNPWAPCTWFTRDYGFISPTPMNWLGDDGLRLEAGQSLRMRYLVVGYAGTPDEADLPGVYSQWVGAA